MAQPPHMTAWWYNHNKAVSSVLTNQLQRATYPTAMSVSLGFLAL